MSASPALAIETSTLLDYQRRGRNLSSDNRRAAEHHFFSRIDMAFNDAVYFRHRNIYYGLSNLSAAADDQRSLRRSDIARKVTIDAQHGSEADFARELQNIADEAKPVVLLHVYSRAAFFTSRNCLTGHYLLSLPILTELN